MAKVNWTVETILSVVHTGLDGAEAKAFQGYCQAEIGALLKEASGTGGWGSLKLKGKGDKAAGTFKGPEYKFTGGHNAATLVLHFAELVLSQADKLGVLPPRVDCSGICQAWAKRRAARGESSPKPEAPAPAPDSGEPEVAPEQADPDAMVTTAEMNNA